MVGADIWISYEDFCIYFRYIAGFASFLLFDLFCLCFVYVLFMFCLCFVLFCFVLFCFVLFCFVLFCFVLFCFVLFCFVFVSFSAFLFYVY